MYDSCMKTCSICLAPKPLSDYFKMQKSKDGVQRFCKTCSVKRNREHYSEFTKQPGYGSWMAMKKRCNNPDAIDYDRYGGRGITYTPDWESFKGFWKDMESMWKKELTLDRIDVNGNYSKDNCRWATSKEQSRNKRDTVFFEIKGVKKPLPEWCEVYGMPYQLVSDRVRSKRRKTPWPLYEALTTPKGTRT